VKVFKDPLYIRILSGLVFAGAFVWVAVRFFNVDVEVIWVFLIMSFIFVFGLIVLGLIFSVLLRLLRRRHNSGLLDSLSNPEKSPEAPNPDAQQASEPHRESDSPQ